MFIAFADGTPLSGSDLLSVTLRTDLIPVPVSLELVAQRTAVTEKLLSEGADVFVGSASIPMTIIKRQVVKTQIIRDADTIGAVAVVAVLKGCDGLIKPTTKAVILSPTTAAGAYRSCGGKSAFGADIQFPEFVCLKGMTPTKEIARRLQEEGAVVRYRAGKVHAVRLPDLFTGQPIATFDPSAVQWLESDSVLKGLVVSVVSLDTDGVTINGDSDGGRPVIYRGGLDSRRARNMSRVLVMRGTMMRPLNERLQAGELVSVGDRRLVVLTAAHRVDTGALGGSTATVTKVWLAEIAR